MSVGAQQVTTLISFTNEWKYDQSGRELGTAWRTNGYDDSEWPSGRGLLGVDDTPGTVAAYNLHSPINTMLNVSSSVTTFYFRATFNFAGSTNGLALVASNLLDDGCVMYLNGLAAGRIRIPGFYNATTTAAGGAPSEGQLDVITLTNLGALRPGQNLLAVEVHQAANTSTDIMWGMKLMAIQPTSLVITDQPQSLTVMVGEPVTLNVGVSGGPAFYQWQRNGANIPSGNSASFSIPSAQLAHAGDYRVIITNAISTVTSGVATVTVLADAVGPRLLAAIGDNAQPGGSATFGSNTVNVLFDEPMNNGITGGGVRNTNHYTIARLGTTNTVTILSVLYHAALGALLNLDGTDPDWIPGGDYLLTISGVQDVRGNVIAPDSQITVAWGQTAGLIHSDALWDFHASAVFEPEVFYENWSACDYVPSFWWAQGQGVLYGGLVLQEPCLSLGILRTATGYQPEPTLYRAMFEWPAHWPSSGTLRVAAAYDDAIVLYLDGREVYRNNVGTAGSPVGFSTRASSTMNLCVTNLAIGVTGLQPGMHCLAAAVPQVGGPSDADSVFALRLDGLAYFAPQLPEQPVPVLNLTPLGTNAVQLSWSGGSYALESSTNLNVGAASYPVGAWQQVTNMSNPYTNRLDEPQRFFRLKK